MKTYVLLHFDIKMTLQSLSNFTERSFIQKFDNDCDVIFMFQM